MATKRRQYEPKAVPTSITANVKLTVKIRDNFISVEGREERTVPPDPDVNLDKEWQFLYDDVYEVCNVQLGKIVKEMDR